ncbi:antirestriction protein [Gilvimarinus sp. SDUM040013]|uniref:Antirestriction protein n=1 Tax=Gilvimarinus gilvus TaxID=3058038 RepID=A0ABU4S006_9GAMM|nr:antirestriction protein [Gilvimarinus sp. SDUM040013]MDO3386026.1 antirestriction protein [Gilvimarinus sp. SDUM040013]MDX6850480.1 antirestriction protein [Gilvimarinus sp. SDUM040013]
MQSNAAEVQPVTAEAVPAEERIDTLPSFFPSCYLEFELMVFDVARTISKTYQGASGYWQFYRLSNGGFYMAPHCDGEFEVTIPFGNGFRGSLSADAFGVAVTLYAYCFIAEKFPDADLADHYARLYDYMSDHKEAGTIWQAID